METISGGNPDKVPKLNGCCIFIRTIADKTGCRQYKLSAAHRQAIQSSKRIANPGCHASGFISAVYPLVHHGLIAPDFPLTAYSLTGYSGGGKSLIEEYTAPERGPRHESHRIYGLNLNHKHLPEMQKLCGLTRQPVFSPILGDSYAGMATTVLLPGFCAGQGKGSTVWDSDGKAYVDMGSGIGVTAFGIGDEIWQQAVIKQIGKVQHTSNLYYTEPCAMLAKLLCEKTGMKKVFFSNSGAEANECAIKVARKYSAEKKGSDCYTILTLENSLHGRTLTTLAATGRETFHRLFQPLTPGFVHIGANIENPSWTRICAPMRGFITGS